MTSAPRTVAGQRSGRGAGADGNSGGPPWTPAPEPGRTLGPLPVAAPGSPPPEPGPGIRVPGDMAVPSAAASEPPAPHPLAGLDTPTPPAGFAMTPPLSGFGPPPAAFAFDPSLAVSDVGPLPATEFPAQEDLGFAAAPVADGYVAPFPAEPAAEEDPAPGPAADPSFIWDLAATDAFPAVTGGDPPTVRPADQDGRRA